MPSLFPLPLAPFERYMLTDDCREYPMMMIVQLQFRGRVEFELLRKSSGQALRRHPLLSAVVRTESRIPVWEPVDLPTVPLVRQSLSEPISTSNDGWMDLSAKPGIRAWIQESPEQVHLTCQIHHACCDGAGVLHFLGDWLAAYDSLQQGTNQPDWRPVDESLLIRRGASRWKKSPRKTSWWTTANRNTRDLVGWLTRHPSSLQPADSGGEFEPFPGLQIHTFTREQTTQLLNAARARRVTVNDLLLRDLFLTLNQWNSQRQAQPARKQLLQIAIPTNLRLDSDAAMPAANVVGYTFLWRRHQECADHQQLLDGIAENTQLIRETNLGQLFIHGLNVGMRVPGFMRMPFGRSSCATALLSNLGVVTNGFRSGIVQRGGPIRAGEMSLERVVASPPVRPGTRAVFTAMTCADQLTLVSRCDPRFFDRRGQQELLETLVARVCESATLPPDPPQ